jgi:hypothetical protein
MSVLRFKDPVTNTWKEISTIKGDPGYTPIKGVDYFDGEDYILTDEDKAEIAQLALEAMPSAEEGEY